MPAPHDPVAVLSRLLRWLYRSMGRRRCRQVAAGSCLASSQVAALILGLLVSLGAEPIAGAQPQLMPHRPLLRGFGGLCDGGPLPCTRIDRLSFYAAVDATVLPPTSLRATAFVAAYGFSFGLLEHLEGGIFSHTAVWGRLRDSQSDTLWQQGPVRLALKGLLWSWRKDPHQRFAVLLDFEYEARLPHFDGPNQLGLWTDLAALRAVGNLPLGLAEVGFSLGALFDGQVGYGTPELGARVGFHLPFMTDTKVFAEGLVRGLGVWTRTSDPLPGAQTPAKPIVPSGALAFGLVTRPRRQVDFAIVAHVGFGDVAPLFLTLRGPLDFAIGDGYPYPQSLVVDILREAGRWIAEQVRKLPEPLKQTCILYGRDGQPIAAMGHLTDDGEHCEFQGQRFRLGDTLYPDPLHRQVCIDPEAKHCVGTGPAPDVSSPAAEQDAIGTLASPATSEGATPDVLLPARRLDPAQLQRLLNQGALGPIRGALDERCILNEGNQQISPIGHISPDGKYCLIERDVNIIKNGKKLRTQVQQVPIPIGRPVYRDPATGRVCLSRNTKNKKDCPAVLDVDHNSAMTTGTRAGYHGALAMVDWASGKADLAKGAAHLLTHPAELTTAALKAKDQAEKAAKKAVETLKDPAKAQQAAQHAWENTVDAAVVWHNQPAEKKLDGLVEGSIKGGLELGAAAVLGVVGKGAELTVAEDVEKAALAGTKAAPLLGETAEVKQLPELPPRRGNGGRGGGPDHARVQARLREELGGVDEKGIPLPNGKRRIVDVEGADGSLHQVGDMRSRNGTLRPSARERGSIEDLREAKPDKDIYFHDKRDQHPPLMNPDQQPDWKPAPRKHRKTPDEGPKP